MKLKNLKRYVALMVAFVMTMSALTGCGNNEKEKDTKKEAQAGSFAETMVKAYDVKDFSYEVKFDFSVTAEEIGTMISSNTALEEILKELGITGNTIEGKLIFDGKSSKDNKQQLKLSVEFGNVKGAITEIIYADDVLYVNISETVKLVRTICEKLGYDSEEMEAYLNLLPEGDYIALSDETLAAYAEALDLSVDLSEFEELFEDGTIKDEESLKDTMMYIYDEVEKIARKADAYSDDDGYTISLNKNNMFKWLKSGIEVLLADIDGICEKLKTVSDTVVDISEEDLAEFKEKYEEFGEEDWDEMEKEVEDEFSEIDEYDISLSAKDKGDSLEYGMKMSVEVQGVKIKFLAGFEITTDGKAVISAPESVVSEKELESLLTILGID